MAFCCCFSPEGRNNLGYFRPKGEKNVGRFFRSFSPNEKKHWSREESRRVDAAVIATDLLHQTMTL